MSSTAKIEDYWEKQIHKIPRPILFIGIVTGVAIIVFFKALPYFADNPVVHPFVRPSDQKSATDQATGIGLSSYIANAMPAPSGRPRMSLPLLGSQSAQTRASAPKVLERPLFDGKNVTLQIRISTSLDSSSGDSSIEGQILGVTDAEQSGSVDSASIKNAVIRGTATPNFDSNRYVARFTDILTVDGKSLPIAGVAFNPIDSSIGIPSDYSSGLPSRLLGGAISRVIGAADQVAQSRVIDDASQSAVDRELSMVARQGSTDTANGLGDEASKGLRETKALLKVPAGAIIFVKMQASRSSGGSR